MKQYIVLLALSLVFLNCSSDSNTEEDPQNSLPTVTTSQIQEITNISASSGGNITDDGGASITARGVCWSTNQNPTIQDNRTVNGSGAGGFTSSIDNLSSNTQYYLRAYATNSVGTAYGQERSFTTIEDEAKVFEGDILFLTQEEIDTFAEQEYTAIIGNVVIGDVNSASTTTILNLEGLSSVVTIDGDFTLHGNDALNNVDGLRNLERIEGEVILTLNRFLTNIDGLNSLNYVGGLRIDQNFLLSNVDGLSNLTEIGDLLFISNNEELINLNGLNNLTSVGFVITISNNVKLSDLNSFNNLNSVYALSIRFSNSLTNISGFSNLTSIEEDLGIVHNDLLVNMSGLNSIETIGNFLQIQHNDVLGSLDDLSSLTSLGALFITDNPVLNDFCGIEEPINNGITGFYDVSDNGYNPSQQDFLDGNCSN